jgi:ABC-2 type transport system permease protein
MTAALALAQRELVRFLRQRSRVIGALVTPVVFWALIGTGVGDSFRSPGAEASYSNYFFPGAILMIVLFTAIFSTVSVIEDRREGFLQGVLVSAVPRFQIALGKILGGAALASLQAFLFLILAPLAGVSLSWQALPILFGSIVLSSVGLTALGLCLAWPMNSTQGFHVLMNLLLMPMWFLSGALFPLRDSMFAPLKYLMLANPMTYALASFRHATHFDDQALRNTLPPLGLSLVVMLLFTLVMLALASLLVRRQGRTTAG